MSKKNYRKDKTCLNCRHVVENKFCPNCGQENTDVRKTFYHLFVHFFEDLTHYENAFWRTIKNLLFKPAALTKEYLSGKRLSYLAPVRLYIFISFVTFFMVAVLPNPDNKKFSEVNVNFDDNKKNDSLTQNEIRIKELEKKGLLEKKDADSLLYYMKIAKKERKKDNFMNLGYHSVAQMDSVREKDKDKIDDLEYWLNKKMIAVNAKFTKEEIIEKAKDSAFDNVPKVLIIYMPFFAFFLWLFHSKKRWYYFDHGIFTLHYFSFLLLIFLIIYTKGIFLNSLIDYHSILHYLNKIISIAGTIWMFYYFFPAHHRFYGETRWVSFFKSVVLFFINMTFIVFLLIAFFFYTIISIK